MSNVETVSTLRAVDVERCIEQLPSAVRDALVRHPEGLVLAGGFVRDVVTGDGVRDIDLFASDEALAVTVANELAVKMGVGMHSGSNLFTLASSPPVQVSFCMPFDCPVEVVEKFDFTVCRASLWHDCGVWKSKVDPRFYPDAAARRLRYCSPDRLEDRPGASLVRILKFYERGYRVSLTSLGRAVARLVRSDAEQSRSIEACLRLGNESDVRGQKKSYYVENDADER